MLQICFSMTAEELESSTMVGLLLDDDAADLSDAIGVSFNFPSLHENLLEILSRSTVRDGWHCFVGVVQVGKSIFSGDIAIRPDYSIQSKSVVLPTQTQILTSAHFHIRVTNLDLIRIKWNNA